MQDADADPDRVPPWIRAHFVMEERWGELESEYYAAAEAIKLAEAWGIVRACAHVLGLPDLSHCLHAATPVPMCRSCLACAMLQFWSGAAGASNLERVCRVWLSPAHTIACMLCSLLCRPCSCVPGKEHTGTHRYSCFAHMCIGLVAGHHPLVTPVVVVRLAAQRAASDLHLLMPCAER